MGQLRCHYGLYSSNYFIYLYHDGSYGYIGSYTGSLRFYAGNTYAAFLESDGDLYLSGVLYESSWSLDDKVVEKKKWQMLDSVLDSYKSHDGSKLVAELRRECKFHTSKVSPSGKSVDSEEVVKYGRCTSDIVQVVSACLAELVSRVERLEKAA